jgi:hypothetical protein
VKNQTLADLVKAAEEMREALAKEYGVPVSECKNEEFVRWGKAIEKAKTE